ncbi:hypothetical protein R3P38DRAFT_2768371 [Favolaschia claudopus]|uniref:Uncharacterized protein n=1 Tax=Favolaschia claudopus TaxID=2862362 RepID=A0AAW0CXF4_9AGAR
MVSNKSVSFISPVNLDCADALPLQISGFKIVSTPSHLITQTFRPLNLNEGLNRPVKRNSEFIVRCMHKRFPVGARLTRESPQVDVEPLRPQSNAFPWELRKYPGKSSAIRAASLAAYNLIILPASLTPNSIPGLLPPTRSWSTLESMHARSSDTQFGLYPFPSRSTSSLSSPSSTSITLALVTDQHIQGGLTIESSYSGQSLVSSIAGNTGLNAATRVIDPRSILPPVSVGHYGAFGRLPESFGRSD